MRYQDRQAKLDTGDAIRVDWYLLGEGWVTHTLVHDANKAAEVASELVASGYEVRITAHDSEHWVNWVQL